MKAILTIILMSLAVNVQARFESPAQLSPRQQEKLIAILNEMEPEILSTVITDETLEWYIEQFNRPVEEESEQSVKPLHGRIELDSFKNSKAPTF